MKVMDEERRRARDEEIVAMLRAEWPDLMAVYLFGSAAKGLERPGSDLDIAALGRSVPGKSTPALTRRIGLAMALKLGVDVDLVDLGVSTIRTRLKQTPKDRRRQECRHPSDQALDSTGHEAHGSRVGVDD